MNAARLIACVSCMNILKLSYSRMSTLPQLSIIAEPGTVSGSQYTHMLAHTLRTLQMLFIRSSQATLPRSVDNCLHFVVLPLVGCFAASSLLTVSCNSAIAAPATCSHTYTDSSLTDSFITPLLWGGAHTHTVLISWGTKLTLSLQLVHALHHALGRRTAQQGCTQPKHAISASVCAHHVHHLILLHGACA